MANSLGHQRSKTPSSPLAGPYGHPFHPMFVTLPIGAWTASIVFDIVALAADEPEPWAQGASLLLALGIVGALLAMIFGFMDYMQIPKRTKALHTATTHMLLNIGVTAALLVSLLLRARDDFDSTNVGLLILSALALGLLAISGWLGGQMAYHYGIRVADEQTQAEAFEEKDVVPKNVSGALRDDSNRYRSNP